MTVEIVLPRITRFPVEAGHIRMFARAVGDANPVYTDPDYARDRGFPDVIAPPTFTEAGIHYDDAFLFRPRPGQPWLGSGREPTGLPREDGDEGTGMHAQTAYTYHRPLTPGCVLQARAAHVRDWTKEGRRGGRLHFHEVAVDYHLLDGTPAVSSTNLYVLTDRKVEQIAPEGDPALRRRALAARDAGPANYPVVPLRRRDAQVGDVHAALLVENLTRTQIIQYAGASGDFSPQHTDEVYNTRVAGYPAVFAPGMLSMALVGRLLTDRLGDQRLESFAFRFKRQVWPGEDLHGQMTLARFVDAAAGRAEFDVVLFNADGLVAGEGTAVALLAA